MAKITGLNVPPSLAEKFNEYVSEKLPTAAGTVSVSRRRKSSKTLSSKSQRRIEDELGRCAAYIATRMGLKIPSIAYNDFYSAEIERLRQGIFLEDYWDTCAVQSDEFFKSIGTSVLDPSPPAYQYRNAEKQPSIVTYAAGIADVSPIRSSGSVISTLWHDTEWVWRRLIFALSVPSTLANQPPVVWQCTGTIHANASNRGSRPMVSALMRAHFIASPSDKTADLSAPLQPATSMYWRYPIPDAAVGNYATAQQVRYMVPLNWRTEDNDAGTVGRVIVKSAVRPMLGHGYNNNDTVTTNMEGEQILWQVADMPEPGNYNANIMQGESQNGTFVYVRSIPELRWRSTQVTQIDQYAVGGGSLQCDLLAFGMSITLIKYNWVIAGSFETIIANGYANATDSAHTGFSVFSDRIEYDRWQLPSSVTPPGTIINVTVTRYKITKDKKTTIISTRSAIIQMPFVTNRTARILKV